MSDLISLACHYGMPLITKCEGSKGYLECIHVDRSGINAYYKIPGTESLITLNGTMEPIIEEKPRHD